jgi:hypothetical protein
MTQKSYQAVRCLFCAEPIPLSASLLSLCIVESGGMTTEQQLSPQEILVRCEACARESHYLKSEIENFEGEPPEAIDVNRREPAQYPRTMRKAADR